MEENFNEKIKELYGVDLDSVPDQEKEKYLDSDIAKEIIKIEDLVKHIEENQVKLDSISKMG